MISQNKIKANRKNSTRSTGPKSEAGKLRSRTNALKHGIFVSELRVSDDEKPEFALLHRALDNQLGPASPLQQIGFERVVWASWRWKLAIRLEMTTLNPGLENEQLQNDAPAESAVSTNAVSTKWYGATNRDRRAALGFLSALRQDIKTNGWVHADTWKEPVTKIFGQEFYESLTEWVPMNISGIQLAEMLSAQAANFNMPLPSINATDVKNDRTTVDPRLSWQMGVKVIDLMKQYLEDLAQIHRRGAGAPGERQDSATLDLVTRYVTTATRDLERAVKWYQYLKEQQL